MKDYDWFPIRNLHFRVIKSKVFGGVIFLFVAPVTIQFLKSSKLSHFYLKSSNKPAFLTITGSVATAERSFFKLKIIKYSNYGSSSLSGQGTKAGQQKKGKEQFKA